MHIYRLNDDEWDEFQRLLNEPHRTNPKLVELLTSATVCDQEEEWTKEAIVRELDTIITMMKGDQFGARAAAAMLVSLRDELALNE